MLAGLFFVQDSRTFFSFNIMSPPRNPGAANFNRLMNLNRRLKQTVRNLALHNLNSQNISNAYRASSRAYAHAETIPRKRAASRQMNRMQANVNRVHATRRRLTAQRNNIRRQIAGILGQRGNAAYNMMAQAHQNNTLAGIRRMQGTRLAQMIERAYLRPGGMFTKKMMSQI
jgi:hypothetical protein